jgi:hypothetical protein
MSCILIRHTYDKNLEMIQQLVQQLLYFLCFRFWQQSDWTEIWSASYSYLLVCTKFRVNSSSSYETCPANGWRRRTLRDWIGSPQASQKLTFSGSTAISSQNFSMPSGSIQSSSGPVYSWNQPIHFLLLNVSTSRLLLDFFELKQKQITSAGFRFDQDPRTTANNAPS